MNTPVSNMERSKIHHFDRGFAWLAAVAAVVGAVSTIVACLPAAAPPAAAPPTAAPPTGSSILGGANSTPTTAGGQPFDYLDTKLAVAGQPRLAGLPDALVGGDGYGQSVVIRCPSNQVGDQLSEVIFETNHRYARLSATLRPYRDPPDGVRADLFVFQDSADRKPGGPDALPPTQVRVTMGGAGDLSADVRQAYYMRVRVVCDRPGGLMVLADARLYLA